MSPETRDAICTMICDLFYARMVQIHAADPVRFAAEFLDRTDEYLIEANDLLFCFRNIGKTASLIMDPATTVIPRDCVVFEKSAVEALHESLSEPIVPDSPVPGS